MGLWWHGIGRVVLGSSRWSGRWKIVDCQTIFGCTTRHRMVWARTIYFQTMLWQAAKRGLEPEQMAFDSSGIVVYLTWSRCASCNGTGWPNSRAIGRSALIIRATVPSVKSSFQHADGWFISKSIWLDQGVSDCRHKRWYRIPDNQQTGDDHHRNGFPCFGCLWGRYADWIYLSCVRRKHDLDTNHVNLPESNHTVDHSIQSEVKWLLPIIMDWMFLPRFVVVLVIRCWVFHNLQQNFTVISMQSDSTRESKAVPKDYFWPFTLGQMINPLEPTTAWTASRCLPLSCVHHVVPPHCTAPPLLQCKVRIYFPTETYDAIKACTYFTW